ncbi:hypothetical protein GX50_08303 [[Emmonsia] crescens]|uniref:Uncharacterized protein n=1 Tax=[Emmonsia] crescens TaxID=73230 RepID=A0A2B7Z814_9EURO|nr:hypothetical protein GX50_08303 [Emmonsia crescens]
MASQYSLLDYDSDEDREQNPEIPVSHLASAAFFIADLLDRHGITYALMGGFAVKLMGGTRNTRDVDIAFQAPGKMRDLCRVVEVEPRLVIPNTKLLGNMMKIFVLTGPRYDNCPTALRVEVGLIETVWTIGFQSSPRELNVNRKQLTVQTSSGPRSIYTLNILYLLRGKMAAFMSRSSENDLYDIRHLLRTYPDEIRASVHRLDPEAVIYFLGTVSEHNRAYWANFFGQ